MRVYIGFDDTDILGSEIGTGKLARSFEKQIPPECKVWGVIRQQLLVDPAIPYTSHNSSACIVVDCPDASFIEKLKLDAIAHLEAMSLPGSDPGLCVVGENEAALPKLISFGFTCIYRIVTQKDARIAAAGIHLSGHGGTNDGIIGAAAAVGLTASGWSGRFIEYAGLRSFSNPVSAEELSLYGIRLVSLDRDAVCPRPSDKIYTKNWLRPRLLGHEAALLIRRVDEGVWESLGEKRKQDKQKTKEG